MTTIRLRRGTSAQWSAADPVLAEGEPGYDTTLGVLAIGDGTSSWSELPKYVDVIPADVPTAFIANAQGGRASAIAAMATDPKNSHVEGRNTSAHGWSNHVEGTSSLADGKISHAEGNTCICSANDAHAEGNRTVAGRRYYRNPAGGFLTDGSEDAGSGLGALSYVLIPDDPYGDVSSYFPNPLTDNVTTRYGAGAQKDSNGNIYGPTSTGTWTPAVWPNSDPFTGNVHDPAHAPITENDLEWAMHPVCILRGSPSETAIGHRFIAKATYTAGIGTKVYFRGTVPGSSGNVLGIYSSYSPVVLSGGNGQHAEGLLTSTWNYGAHAEGAYTRAWGYGAHSEGRETAASGYYAHSEGYQTEASGMGARATGQQSRATRDWQQAHSPGQRAKKGDSQTTTIDYAKSCAGAGWHEINILRALVEGSYHFETMVLGRQTAGSAGAVGNSFAYKFQGLVSVDSDGSVEVNGGPVARTLVGRADGMSGDGLSSGERMSFDTAPYGSDSIKSRLVLRFDGLANTTFWIQTHSVIQEFIA